MRGLLTALAFAALASPAVAAPPGKTALLAKAAEGVSICATHMPDSRKTRQALTEAGFRKETADDNRAEYFSAMGYRVVVIVTMTHSTVAGCGVVTANATPDEAQALLQPVLTVANAKPIPQPGSLSVGAERAWLGVFKGGPTLFLVDDSVNLGPLKGAAAFARSLPISK